MSANPAAPTDQRYTETSNTSITLDTAAQVDETFKVYIGSTPDWRESDDGFVGLSITIPNSKTFTPGDSKMLVFRNGVLLHNSVAVGTGAMRYQEAGNNGITLEDAATASDFFEFIYMA